MAKVRDMMMSAPVLTIDESDNLALASQMMVWAGVRHLPVTRHGQLVGVISEHDILSYQAKRGAREAARAPVRDATSQPLVTIGPDQDMAEAAALMLDRRVGCLPVLRRGQLIGIVTSTDVLGYEAGRRSGPTGAARLATVAEVMTTRPETVHEDDDLLDAVARMMRGARHLPVIDGEDRVVGALSERDVRSAVGDPTNLGPREAALGARVQLMKVSHAMSSNPVIVRPNEPLAAAARRLMDPRVGALVVVDDADHVVGQVSYLDLLKTLFGRFWELEPADVDAGAAALGEAGGS
jgi:CBS domain-containing membrane protein/CBS domain-containing protein